MKMMEASKGYCAYCKPTRRTDHLFDQIIKKIGICREHIDDTIWNMGANPEIVYHDTVWNSCRPLEKAKIWYLNRLKGICKLNQKQEKEICEFLEETSEDGMVKETTNTTLVTMIWKVPNK